MRSIPASLPPCTFTWEWQSLAHTLCFGSGTPAAFMFLLLQHLICFGLFPPEPALEVQCAPGISAVFT